MKNTIEQENISPIDVQPTGKKISIFSLIMGILSLLAFAGGIAMAFVLDVQSSAGAGFIALVSNMIASINDGGAIQINNLVYVSLVGIIAVAVIVYNLVGSILILVNKQKKGENNGNVRLLLTAGMLLFAVIALFDVKAKYAISGIGYDIFTYTTLAVFAIRLVYGFVFLTKYNSKCEGKGGALATKIIGTILCVGALVFAFFGIKVISSPVDYYNLAVNGSLINGVSMAIVLDASLIVDSIFGVITALLTIWLVVEVARVIIALISFIFKFTFKGNYFFASYYFTKTSPWRSAFLLGLIALLLQVVVPIVYNIVTGAPIDASTIDYVVIGVFVAILVLCIVYSVVTKADRRKRELEEEANLMNKLGTEVAVEVENADATEIPVEPVVDEKPVAVEKPATAEPQTAQPQQPANAQQAGVYGAPVMGQPVIYTTPMGQPVIYGAPVMGQPVIYAMPGMPVGQPAQAQPAAQPATKVEEEIEEEDVVGNLNITRKTLEEKLAELPAQGKKYYKTIIDYAMAKVGVKRMKGVYGDGVSYGRDSIVKVNIKQGVVVCSFSLTNYEVKEMIKSAGGSKAKESLTVVRVKDADSLGLAKTSIDMAYKLALEAKEERHQEQLKKRREARAEKKTEEAKPEAAKTEAKKPVAGKAVEKKPEAKKPATKKPASGSKK